MVLLPLEEGVVGAADGDAGEAVGEEGVEPDPSQMEELMLVSRRHCHGRVPSRVGDERR